MPYSLKSRFDPASVFATFTATLSRFVKPCDALMSSARFKPSIADVVSCVDWRIRPNAPDAAWLTRIEQAQMLNPADPALQYLAGMTCMRLQLWGKAQQLLKQSVSRLSDATLQRNAWRALAELAEQRADATAAAQAWREAAKP